MTVTALGVGAAAVIVTCALVASLATSLRHTVSAAARCASHAQTATANTAQVGTQMSATLLRLVRTQHGPILDLRFASLPSERVTAVLAVHPMPDAPPTLGEQPDLPPQALARYGTHWRLVVLRAEIIANGHVIGVATRDGVRHGALTAQHTVNALDHPDADALVAQALADAENTVKALAR